jgi:hypothetical protein
MELILGLKPMSQFDAAATPMFDSFQAEPDLRPYNLAPANVDLDEKNTSTAWGAELKMNFRQGGRGGRATAERSGVEIRARVRLPNACARPRRFCFRAQG